MIVAVAFVTMSVASPIATTYQLFYQAYKDQFQWSHASISGVLGLHQFLNGAMSPLVGWALDRYGPRRLMPAGALIVGLALAASSQINALWQLYVTFGVVAAIGVAMIQSVPNAVVVSNWFIKNRGTAIGIMLAGSGLGQLLLTPATQWLILHTGWRTAYLALAPLVSILPVVLILLFLYHRPSDKGLLPYGEGKAEAQESRREVVVLDRKWADTAWSVGRAARTYRFWAMAAMTAAFSFGYFLISPQLFVLTQEHGEFQQHSVLVALILGTGGLHKGLSKFAGGLATDRFGPEKTMTISVGIVLAGILFLNLVQKHPSPSLFLVAVLFYGMGYGLSLPVLMSSYADVFQGPKLGAILGTLTLGGLLGAALGTGLGGYLRDVTGGYQMSFVVSSIAFALSVALMWSARPGRIRTVRRVASAGGALESHSVAQGAVGTD